MKVLVAGSKDWSDYNDVMRNMTIVLDDWVKSNPEDKKITFVHAGNRGAENMVTEYIGKVERLISQKGYKISEKVYSLRPYINERQPNIARDNDIVMSGADMAVVFIKGTCPRTEAFARLVSAYQIPLEIVRD